MGGPADHPEIRHGPYPGSHGHAPGQLSAHQRRGGRGPEADPDLQRQRPGPLGPDGAALRRPGGDCREHRLHHGQRLRHPGGRGAHGGGLRVHHGLLCGDAGAGGGDGALRPGGDGGRPDPDGGDHGRPGPGHRKEPERGPHRRPDQGHPVHLLLHGPDRYQRLH